MDRDRPTESRPNLVAFHYYEKNETYRQNLIYFLCKGLNQTDRFVIIISGSCSVALPELANVSYLFVPNRNLDFGGFAALLKRVRLADYRNFLFVNSSVRGPFLPKYVETDWVGVFCRNLRHDTHLVGSSISVLPPDSPYLAPGSGDAAAQETPAAHVQTTAYALSSEAMTFLTGSGFYDIDRDLPKHELIKRYELRLSGLILSNGWNISCLAHLYGDQDYRTQPRLQNHTARFGDTLYRKGFFGRAPSPYELVFVKTNRNLISKSELASLTYINLEANADKPAGFADGDRLLADCQAALGRPKRRFLKDLPGVVGRHTRFRS